MLLEVMTYRVPDSIMGTMMSVDLEWAKRFAKYVRQKWPQTQFSVLTNINGDQNLVHWVAQFESMAARDACWEHLWQEQEAKKLVDEVVALERKHGGNPFATQINHNFYNIVDAG